MGLEEGEEHRIWGENVALSLTGPGSLGPQFPHLYNGIKNSFPTL